MTVIATRTELNITQTDSANVIITVNRNRNAPVFTAEVYTGVVFEKDEVPMIEPLNEPVFATDLDDVSFHIQLV